MLKIREYAKAIAALLGAIATFFVSVNAPGEWSIYLGSIVAILTGVATFGVRDPRTLPTPDGKAVTSLDDIQAKLDQTRQAAQNNLEQVAQSTVDSITAIQQSLGAAAGTVPGVGPLVQAAIDSMKLPRP